MSVTELRLAEALTSLSLAIDLGVGAPMQTMLKTALIAVRLARAAGLSADDEQAAFYLALLRYVGCSTTSHATSFVIGDELGLGELLVAADDEVPAVVAQVLGQGRSPAEAEAAVTRAFAAFGAGLMVDNHRSHCEAARLLARRFGLGAAVDQGLAHVYERWDGHSSLRLAAGEAISLPMRVAQVALLAATAHNRQDAAGLAARARARAGTLLDPGLCALLAEDPWHFMAGCEAEDLTAAALAAEPGTPIWLRGAAIDQGLAAIADFGDFKTPHMLGHSRRVADLAHAAARAASLPEADTVRLRRAGLVHDIGRVGLPAQLLVKTGRLSRSEHERIRLHAYLSGRVFADCPVLAPIGALGAQHHERMDGSGYHRGLAGAALAPAARLLAAANAWCALTEPRPHRPQMTEAAAAAALSADARAGLFDAKAVEAVLTAAGQRGARTRRAAALALSEREIEVLRLLAREATNPAIAHTLGISPKTVERHVTHIFDKLGVGTRAGAALHALEAGLL